MDKVRTYNCPVILLSPDVWLQSDVNYFADAVKRRGTPKRQIDAKCPSSTQNGFVRMLQLALGSTSEWTPNRTPRVAESAVDTRVECFILP